MDNYEKEIQTKNSVLFRTFKIQVLRFGYIIINLYF